MCATVASVWQGYASSAPVGEALRLGQSGMGLKDRMAEEYLPFGSPWPQLLEA